jgi:site-specific DNA recombinase
MTKENKAEVQVAAYARVSTEEQRDGQTIDSQIAELEDFARAKGWNITQVYRDAGWSGSTMARPALDRLRDDARAGQFRAVLVNDVDRLARDVSHLGVVKRDFERHGVSVIFRKLPPDAGPISNLLVNILGSFAEFEREMIIDRTRRGRRHKVESRKQYLGSNTAFGYRYTRMDRVSHIPGLLEVEPA